MKYVIIAIMISHSAVFSQDTTGNKRGRIANTIPNQVDPLRIANTQVETKPNINNPINTSTDINDLMNRIIQLESEVNAIKNRIPFHSMSLIQITADKNSLVDFDEQKTLYTTIRIDHPITTNNPHAKIFYNSTSQHEVFTLRYNAPYWEIIFSTLKSTSVQPYTLRTISVAAISSLGHTRFTGLIETEDAGTPALTGPLWGAMSYIRQGDKFNFIVFRELPEKTKIAAQSNRE